MAAASMLCACAGPGQSLCEGPEVSTFPVLRLNAQQWFSAHPGGGLEACFMGVCKRANGENGTGVQFQPSSHAAAADEAHPLDVTLTENGEAREVERDVRLNRHAIACQLHTWETTVYLQSDGQMS